MRDKVQMIWQVGPHTDQRAAPEKVVPAVVPGAVQLDWARAEGWAEYTFADEYKRFKWMEDMFWTYRAKLDFLSLLGNERLFFVCKGIDYKFQVKLHDAVLYEQEGMFTPFEIDLTDRAKSGDELQITVFPAPKRSGAPEGR